MTLELLSAAARAATGPVPDGLPLGMLRFTLEYAAPVDLQVERAKLVALLGADNFDLRGLPFETDPCILILQFPGIERQQSATALFQEADALVEGLGLVSATPEVDPGWIEADELGRDVPESVSGVVRALCESSAPAPIDRLWAIKSIGADRAWSRHGARGAGIFVAQPDTGVADHRELDGAVALTRGIDILAGQGLPIDTLTHAGNPGHGTATSSCVASRTEGAIAGAAPEATVVPIRCANAVVLTGGSSLAAAIDHARLTGCHVITMSLGGPIAFPDVKRAIRRAVDAGLLVVAAAGNCVGLVVYPAWDPEVIAVAGVDEHDRPWRGTSRGPAIDIAAPAENVHVARRTTPNDLDLALVRPGQGTSFAVALVAGCAALWLSHYGLAEVRAEAKQRGVTVQALFRAAIQARPRRPVDWPGGMGPGIIDVEALLELPLVDIPGVDRPRSPGHPLQEVLGADFDWKRYGAEAAFLAFDRAQRSDPARAAALESPASPRPSPGLIRAIEAAGRRPSGVLGAPAIVTSPLTPQLTPRDAVRAIAGSGMVRSRRVESGGAVSEAAARSYLSGVGRQETLDAAHEMLKAAADRGDRDGRVTELRDTLAAALPGVLAHLAAGGQPDTMVGTSRVALEALVLMTGRPAFRVQDGKLDVQKMEDWVSYYGFQPQPFDKLFTAVGRIDIWDGVEFIHVGTGTLVAPDLVMTNRHVLDAIADPLPGREHEFRLQGQISIAFDELARDPRHRFEIAGVASAGPDRIGQQVDIAKLDMAFLTVRPTNADGQSLPQPAQVSEHAPRGGAIFVVGYPARPGAAAVTDPSTGQISTEMLDRLFEIYHNDYGVKYVSPGRIGREALTGDVRGWGFTHDATTLAGNSGSAIINLDEKRVSGLHFGGAPLRRNMAHDLGVVRAAAAASGVIDPVVLGQMGWPV